LDLIWLEDFMALASIGNFSRAAEARHMTQPAFSRRIRALEEWVGVPLFDRDTQPVTPTAAGNRFKPAAAELLRRLAEARTEARDAGLAAAATLRFAATHALSSTFFPAWLRRFEASTGAPVIQLISETLQTCEQLMLNGEAEFLLCHHHPAATGLDPARFPSIAVGTDRLIPVTAPDPAAEPRHRFQPGTKPAPYLAYSLESGMGRIVRAAFADEDYRWLQPVLTSHLAGALKAMAEDGRGIAWLPESLIKEELAQRRLIPAADARWNIPVEIRLVRARGPQTAKAEEFWTLVAAST
jgi:LysR family transcriptional regulator, hypochlorite-specific transcription factor HypT